MSCAIFSYCVNLWNLRASKSSFRLLALDTSCISKKQNNHLPKHISHWQTSKLWLFRIFSACSPPGHTFRTTFRKLERHQWDAAIRKRKKTMWLEEMQTFLNGTSLHFHFFSPCLKLLLPTEVHAVLVQRRGERAPRRGWKEVQRENHRVTRLF